jgi:hypothetical protein
VCNLKWDLLSFSRGFNRVDEADLNNFIESFQRFAEFPDGRTSARLKPGDWGLDILNLTMKNFFPQAMNSFSRREYFP